MTKVKKQTTIAKPATLEGIGLHTGEAARITLKPASENFGIQFFRLDVKDFSEGILAHWESVVDTARCTCLGLEGTVYVRTVEHLLSACFGLGVDNLRVELEGSELPALDGSAMPFAMALRSAGILAQTADQPVFELPSFVFSLNGSEYRLDSREDLWVSAEILYPGHPLVASQCVEMEVTPESYLREIAPARTYGFEEEVQQLISKGLARGGSLENAVVIGRDKIYTQGGLRFPDEPVRHKLLDLLGDLALLGGSIRGHLKAVKPSHFGNVELLKKIANQ